MNKELQHVLDGAVRLFLKEWPNTLTGVYAHGSLALGGFNPARSDVDLLALLREPGDRAAYRRIAEGLMRLEDEGGGGAGFEMSIVLAGHAAADFVFPTPFECHYSAAHRDRYRHDPQYVCGGFADPDLAAHFAVAHARGLTLCGTPAPEAFRPVDRRHVLASVLADVREAADGIAGNPVYHVLNLCRTLRYARESAIASKREGGEWALAIVPPAHRAIIERCLAAYAGNVGADSGLGLSPEELASFAGAMLEAIEREAAAEEGPGSR
ncbi:DUF4111 domain-containing protein [Paenibacillus sp. MWE-103]|uniref:Spectinomycin 9-adenylyltransferase n=1 Tax=Paenibacillus artemisiicola TaxID=1172618 RepID=A0ABS3WJC2_9BACL|nr:aminoglycoside adenylyltransferase domain-containing protein [Paenibacillus artemisiicola]MBO7748431.1 DUF4111 domain-containing protein [Paenibacillus artemisiicola]